MDLDEGSRYATKMKRKPALGVGDAGSQQETQSTADLIQNLGEKKIR